MTRNGKHATYQNGDDWGMVYYCFNHINSFVHMSLYDTYIDYRVGY